MHKFKEGDTFEFNVKHWDTKLEPVWVKRVVKSVHSNGNIDVVGGDGAAAAFSADSAYYLENGRNFQRAKSTLVGSLAFSRLDVAIYDIESEYLNARAKFSVFNSAHEGFAVLLEEVEELKEAVFKKGFTPEQRRLEAKQVAAMALAFMLEVD